MHLIDALASGVNGAGNGYAKIYSRGTSTKATCYSDYQGTVMTQPDTGLALDANGGTVVYVNENVDVVVLDSTGTAVREFTPMVSANDIEYIGASGTGVDYTSGASATSKPVTLQALLDDWETSAGEPDFEVLFNGTKTLLKNALGGITNVFFNVKSPEYGALGDGSTDDTTAIQAAITAANAAGGGIVLFPKGTYRTTDSLTVYAKVHLWGTSAAGSILSIDHASKDVLYYNDATTSIGYEEIRNLTIIAGQTNSGYQIRLSTASARLVKITGCKIGNSHSNGAYTVYVDAAASRVIVEDSDVYTYNASGGAMVSNGPLPWVILRGSRFYSGASTYDGSLVTATNLRAQGCDFDLSSSSTSSVGMYAVTLTGSGGTTVRASLVGNRFVPPAGGTSYALFASSCNNAATYITEVGSVFVSGFTTVLSGLKAGSNDPQIQTMTRDTLKYSVSSDAASLSIDPDQYGTMVLTRTTNGAQTINCNNVPGKGAFFTLRVLNSIGGASGTITFGTGFIATTPVITALANGKSAIYLFRAEYAGGVAALVPQAAYMSTT